MATKGEIEKIKRKWATLPVKINDQEFTTGVEEVCDAEGMVMDVEATATKVVSPSYKQIIARRDEQRLIARLRHQEWMKKNGYAK